jgi:3-oxoacyl-[acyl-carrier protein] reductase
MEPFSGKVVMVTGGARGIGESIARECLRAGGRVWLNDLNEDVFETALKLDPSGTRCSPTRFDVRDERAFAASFAHALATFSAVDVMVNNAGISVSRSVWDISAEEWNEVLEINLRSVFFGCRIAGDYMRKRGGGRIVNIASLAGQRGGNVAGAHYSASKAGVLTLTKVFAQELASSGVTVNSIAPGMIEGPNADAMPKDKIAALAKTVPVGRMGLPDEVAAAVLYLASDAAAYVTGATIDINGGLYMR